MKQSFKQFLSETSQQSLALVITYVDGKYEDFNVGDFGDGKVKLHPRSKDAEVVEKNIVKNLKNAKDMITDPFKKFAEFVEKECKITKGKGKRIEGFIDDDQVGGTAKSVMYAPLSYGDLLTTVEHFTTKHDL